MKYSVIIPCYNEGKNIKRLVCVLERLGHLYDIEWIFVENGSSDDTGERLKEYCEGKEEFRITCVSRNRGYGYGIRKGLEIAIGDYVGWLHGDMQVSPQNVIRLIEAVEKEGEAARLFLKGKRKNRRASEFFFTCTMGIYASLLFGTCLTDIGAVPVLFHRELLLSMPMMPYDFSIETYAYLAAKKMNYEIRRYPVILKSRSEGKSSWNQGMRTKFRWSRIIVRDLILIKKGMQVK